MTRETLKQIIMGGIDTLLAHPLIVGGDKRLVLLAEKDYWDNAARLDELLQIVHAMKASAKPLESDDGR